MIKEVRKFFTGPRPIVRLLLMANLFAVRLTVQLTLEDKHKIEKQMMDNPVNSLSVSMMDDLSIPMQLPIGTYLKCYVVLYDRWASEDTTIKSDWKRDKKEEKIREKRDGETNLSPIIYN